MHVRSKGTQAHKPYRAREVRNLAHSPLIRLLYKLASSSYQMQPTQNINKIINSLNSDKANPDGIPVKFIDPMGCYDRAEVCEIVGCFMLNELSSIIKKEMMDLVF